MQLIQGCIYSQQKEKGSDVSLDRDYAILICDHIDTASKSITMMFNSNNLYDDQEIYELYQERVKLDMLYKELRLLILSWKGETV